MRERERGSTGSGETDSIGDVITVTDYNIDGNVTKVRYTTSIGESEYVNSYDEGNVSRILLPNGIYENVEYDKFRRVTCIEHPTHREKIQYHQNGGIATNLIAAVHHGDDRTRYTYDVNVNITEVTANGKLVSRYAYDGLGRLLREDNSRIGKSATFEYDANGNMTTRNAYPFSLNELIEGDETKYGYAKEGNRDRLISFNGKNCEYDAIGNPTKYCDKVLSWEDRDLVKYDDMSFSYNASGTRLSKSRDGERTEFLWAKDRLIAEKRTFTFEDLEIGDYPSDDSYSYGKQTDLTYIHGADGLTGFTVLYSYDEDVKRYYYRKSAQGDVTHIFDQYGNIKAEYIYDAWGNHKIIRDDDGVGSLNPIRYRGYYFDNETGLYNRACSD